MGLLTKLFAPLVDRNLANGMVEEYKRVLKNAGEYNSNIYQCFDINHSLGMLKNFIQKYNVEATQSSEVFREVTSLKFEGQEYFVFLYRHYARAITILLEIKITEKKQSKIYDFLNEVNIHDNIHQIGSYSKNGENRIRIMRQFLTTPEIGNCDDFATTLRNMKNYGEQLSRLEMPQNDYWERCVNIKSSTTTSTAHDFWYPKSNDESLTYKFSKECEHLTTNDSYDITRIPIVLPEKNCPLKFSAPFYQSFIQTYNKYPYYYKIYTNVNGHGQQILGVLKKKHVENFCNIFNAYMHFAPIKAVFLPDQYENEYFIIIQLMGLYAGDPNTHTYVDVLCAFQKAVNMCVASCLSQIEME